MDSTKPFNLEEIQKILDSILEKAKEKHANAPQKEAITEITTDVEKFETKETQEEYTVSKYVVVGESCKWYRGCRDKYDWKDIK